MAKIILLLVFFVQILHYSRCLIEVKLDLIQNYNKTENGNQIINSLNEEIEGSINILTDNDLFTVPLTIGTPKQTFNVLLDTGSFLMWVSSINSKDQYVLPQKFNQYISITYKSLGTSFVQQYVSGQLSGSYSEDNVSVYQKELRFHWGLAFETSTSLSCDGIIGMGHEYLPKDKFQKSMSLMEQLLNNNHIKQNIFSVKRDLVVIKNSRLFIGGYHEDFNENNKNHTGSCKLSSGKFWSCTMTHIVIGHSSVEAFKNNSIEFNKGAIFDTGTNRIIVPLSLLDAVMKLFPSTCQKYSINNFSSLRCSDINNLPDVSLVFNGFSYKLNKYGLYGYSSKDKAYYSLLLFTSSISEILIGMPFFYNLHVAFDNEKQIMKFYSRELSNIVDVSKVSNLDSWIENPVVIVGLAIGGAIILGVIIYGIVVYIIKKQRNEATVSLDTISPILS